MSDDKLKIQIPPAVFHPDQILSDAQLAILEGTSVDTIQRRRARGEGPKRTELSERRHGTRFRHWLEWLDSVQEGQTR